MTDITDHISELIDGQLETGESPQRCPDNSCPHCDRDWHGLAITEKIVGMYDISRYDENYRYDTDDSPVVCPGSDFIGPVPEHQTPTICELESFWTAARAMPEVRDHYRRAGVSWTLGDRLQEFFGAMDAMSEYFAQRGPDETGTPWLDESGEEDG